MRRSTERQRKLADAYRVVPGMKVGAGVYGIVQKAWLRTPTPAAGAKSSSGTMPDQPIADKLPPSSSTPVPTICASSRNTAWTQCALRCGSLVFAVSVPYSTSAGVFESAGGASNMIIGGACPASTQCAISSCRPVNFSILRVAGGWTVRTHKEVDDNQLMIKFNEKEESSWREKNYLTVNTKTNDALNLMCEHAQLINEIRRRVPRHGAQGLE